MDERTEGTLTSIIYWTLAFVFIYIVFNNYRQPWPIVIFSGLLAGSITVRNVLFYGSETLYKYGKFAVVFDVIIIYFITASDISAKASVFYFVIIGDAALHYSYSCTVIVSLLSYISFIVERYLSLDYPSLWTFLPDTVFQSLTFIVVTAIMFVVRYEIKQKDILNKTMNELKVKSRQLENAYVKLKKNSEELEEVTILKERNRIAREVHDTVGHTLTTVLMELEAGERLVEVNPGLAAEKVRLAKGQVRKGLNDIRQSVRALQAGSEVMEFIPSLKLLIDDITKHGDIFIDYEFSDIPKLNEKQEKMIYRALQEGLTNGIRHGNSTAFVFKLRGEKEHINFFLQDNGQGTDKIVPGFGLNAMEERVKELGGVLSLSSKKEEGCTIEIRIPV